MPQTGGTGPPGQPECQMAQACADEADAYPPTDGIRQAAANEDGIELCSAVRLVRRELEKAQPVQEGFHIGIELLRGADARRRFELDMEQQQALERAARSLDHFVSLSFRVDPQCEPHARGALAVEKGVDPSGADFDDASRGRGSGALVEGAHPAAVALILTRMDE